MNTDTCLRPGCGKKALIRGLCTSCYQFARRLVESRKVTMERLEETGKILPSKTKSAALDYFLDNNP